MIRERNQGFKIAFIALDMVLSAVAFAVAVTVHFVLIGAEKQVLPDRGGLFAPGLIFGESQFSIIFGTYFYLGVIIVLSQIAVFVAIDLYHPRRGLSFYREMAAIIRGVLYNIVIVLALLFFYRGTTYSRMVILYTLIFSVVVHTTGHYYFRKLMSRLRQLGFRTKNVMILGTGFTSARLVKTLTRHSIYGYRVVGLLGPRTGSHPHIRKMIVGSLRELKKAAGLHRPEMIIFAMHPDPTLLKSVLDFCDQEGIDFRIIPELTDIITHRARIEDLDGMPLLTIRDIPLNNGYNRIIKRTFDILFSFSFLAVFSPLYVILAILVKLDSPGPIFFVQERVGLDRKLFRLVKFRTMVVQDKSRSDTVWGSKSDARVTRLGKFLRKTSLDELPQFFNVLKGDMSIVGPRPERPHFVEQFKSRYYHYMRRHSVKSGITGWAQIQGLRGDTSIQKRVELDIFYIENWSIWLDVSIALRTIPSMLKNPGE